MLGDRASAWEPTGIYLVLEETQATGGMFRDLETWLREHDIPFNRMNDPYPGEWGYELVRFRPGWPLQEVPTNDAYSPVIPEDDVRATLAAVDTLEAFRQWLDREYPPMPPLPPITWA